ncbi:MAG: hypothetical protein WCR33_03830 [Bacilli bacterium]
MKKRLYDFNTFTGILILVLYIFLGFVFTYGIVTNSSMRLIFIILDCGLLLTLLMLLWYYFYLAILLTDKGVKHGAKFIPASRLKCKNGYNARFREEEIIFYDKYVNYDKLTEKVLKRSIIKVENTKRNCAIVNQFFEGGINEKIQRKIHIKRNGNRRKK